MALTTTFEKFAKKQREANPNITDAEIEQLWSEQPLNKRIASGIESAVLTPARAIASIPEAVGAGYKKLDDISRGGPNLSYKYKGEGWSSPKEEQSSEAKTLKTAIAAPAENISSSKNVGPVADGEKYAQALASLSTPEVKKEAKKAVAATDTAAKDAQKAANKGEIPQAEADRFKEERDRAYKMYSEAKDRNEWLELAQILGQAVTQYGAAQVGMRTGRSMAGLQIPSIDYGARTAQEQRLLETRLRDIGEEETREQRLAEKLREDKREEERLGLERRRVQLAEQEARRTPVDTTEQRELRREERKEQKATEQAITNIKAALATLAVGNKKQKEEAMKSIDANIAQSGLPGGVVSKIVELKKEPGWFGGSAWEAKRQEVESLLQSSTPSATIPSGGKVRVRKGSEVLEIPESDLAAARADGYELER